MREAVFIVSPKTLNLGSLVPMSPVTTEPVCSPTRTWMGCPLCGIMTVLARRRRACGEGQKEWPPGIASTEGQRTDSLTRATCMGFSRDYALPLRGPTFNPVHPDLGESHDLFGTLLRIGIRLQRQEPLLVKRHEGAGDNVTIACGLHLVDLYWNNKGEGW